MVTPPPDPPSVPESARARLSVLGPLRLEYAGTPDPGGLLRQPKKVGLLAYMALRAPDGFLRRDQLLALFWPDSDAARARNSLSQSLHRVRRALGPGVFRSRGAEEIGVDREYLRCDAHAFEALLAEGRRAEALDLYRGDLLDGLHVPDAAPELDQWLDAERARLRSVAVAAAVRLGEEAQRAGDLAAALVHFQRAARLDPGDEAVLRRVLRALAASGNRAAALALFEEHARRQADEYGIEPEAETRSLADHLRRASAPPPDPASLEARPVAPDPAPGRSTEAGVDLGDVGADGPLLGGTVPPSSPRRRRPHPAVAGAALALVATVFLAWALIPEPTGPQVVAIGQVETQGAPESAPGIRELLTAGLGRIPAVEVVARERMEEVRARLGTGAGDPDHGATVARAAGASELVEARVTPRRGGGLRMELIRRDIRRGTVRGSYTVEASDPYDLVDLAVEEVARDLGLQASVLRSAGRGASLPAYRLYEEGLRAYHAMDVRGAGRLFRAALAEDTAFAMAAYYASLTADTPERWDLHARAVRLAERSGERERLLIRTTYAANMQDPAVLSLAQELAERYPTDPDGHLQLGQALLWRGDFHAAVLPLRRVLSLDSLEVPGGHPRCRSCDAFDLLGLSYRLQDSVAAAVRLGRERVAAQPESPAAWTQLAAALEFADSTDQALQALRQAEALQPGLDLTHTRTSILTRAGDYEAVEQVLQPLLSSGSVEARSAALWGLVINRRQRGRLEEALTAARVYRALNEGATAALPEAVVRLEMGDAQGSAALFRAMADAAVTGRSPSLDGRARAWALVHVATALAEMGDVEGLGALEDSIRVHGGRSAYGRDRRLHHHVRGLRLRLEGRWEEAVAAFLEARFSPVEGFVRTNLELARALEKVGRPEQALDVARSALRGPVSASGLYATRTEFQEIAARAFEALDRPDSAAVYHGRVLAAWDRADPILARRVAEARRRRAALSPAIAADPALASR